MVWRILHSTLYKVSCFSAGSHGNKSCVSEELIMNVDLI
nr:MAG TPA: hypothetical protein [Caudoviricetes sp.]